MAIQYGHAPHPALEEIDMRQNLSLALALSDDHDVKRDVVIKLLVTQAERDVLQAAADAEHVTLSEFIRSRILKSTTTVEAVKAKVREEFIRRGTDPKAPKKGGR
jgi:DNA-binding MarR family transcriptional regulator